LPVGNVPAHRRPYRMASAATHLRPHVLWLISGPGFSIEIEAD
jgi:hypothetical protein